MTTTEWYVEWLKDNYPDWSDEQRLEIATGFAKQQEFIVGTVVEVEEPVADDPKADARAKRRKDERMLRGYMSSLLKEAGE